MAERRITVLNPAGYQEVLQTSDNLLLDAAPSLGNHAVNKTYTDTEVGNKLDTSGGTINGNLTVTGNVEINGDLSVDGTLDCGEYATDP